MSLYLVGLGLVFSQARTGVSYAEPGGQAVVRLELRPAAGHVLQKRTLIGLEHPFRTGIRLEQNPTGQNWPADPEHYLERANPLEWRIVLPQNTRPGEYPLRFFGTAYVCQTNQGVCFRQKVSTTAVLRVGARGQDQIGILEIKPDPKSASE